MRMLGRDLTALLQEPVAWANEPTYAWPPSKRSHIHVCSLLRSDITFGAIGDFQDAEKAYENFLLSCVNVGPLISSILTG